MTKSEVLLLDEPSAKESGIANRWRCLAAHDPPVSQARPTVVSGSVWRPGSVSVYGLKQKEVRCHHGRFSCHLPHFEVFAAKHGL